MFKQELKFLTIFTVTVFVTLFIASIWDLQISKTVMDQNSVFGTFFQTFGMFPPGLVGFISCQIIFNYTLKKNQPLVLKLIFIFASLGLAFWSTWGWVDGWMYYGATALQNIKDKLPLGQANNNIGAEASYSFALETFFVFIISIVGTYLCYLWLNKKNLDQFQYLVLAAISGLALVYLSGSVVSTMKVNWGRFRPYEVKEIVSSSKNFFTSWWVLSGNTGHQSFPSGHMLSAMTAVFLPFFVDRKNIRWQKIMAYTTIIYSLMMALARVRLGAHFLSDVTVSAIIVMLMTFLIMKVLGYSFIEPNPGERREEIEAAFQNQLRP